MNRPIAAGVLLACGALSTEASAQPAVFSVAGEAVHGGEIQVQGSAFGPKEPAAPMMWDDAEGRTLESPEAVSGEGGWSEVWPRSTMAVRDAWKMQYRAAGFRTVPAPHPRSSAYVVGGHWNDADDQGRNVHLTMDSGSSSNDWYASWYIRLDPGWPADDGHQCTLVPNYKDYVFQGGPAGYDNPMHYSACTSCIVNRLAEIQTGHGWFCDETMVAPDPVPRPSEMFDWRRREVLLRRSPGYLRTYSYDGEVGLQPYNFQCPGGENLQSWLIRSFTIGGFMKNSDSSQVDPPYDYPNWAPIRDLSDHWYAWVQRGGSDEYYVTFDGAEVGDDSPDPWIKRAPVLVRFGAVDSTLQGTVGALDYAEWAYGDFDGLGFDTLYVRLPDGVADRNPQDQGPCTVVLTTDVPQDEGHGRSHPDAFRYFDDVYVDTTFSRIVLANDESYQRATIVEPQLPSAWGDTAVTATVNLGQLPAGQTAYLFVFDADNEHNDPGVPVEVGAGGSGGAGGGTAGGVVGGSSAGGGAGGVGSGASGDDGCGCRLAGGQRRMPFALGALLLALGRGARRRRAHG